MLRRVSLYILICVAMAVAAQCLAQEPEAPRVMLGRVLETRLDDQGVHEEPLEGALVLLGRGILLDTGGDGRDAVVASDDPENRPAVELGHTDEAGEFAVPLPPGSGVVDVLIWSPGCTPVLRQAVDPYDRPVFRIRPGAPSLLHVSLTLPDGRLILPQLADSAKIPFVEPGLGLLVPLPSGYRRRAGSGPFTVAGFTDGNTDILILRAPSRLDDRDMAELLREQTERVAGAPRLVRARDVLLDGRRATWREFVDEDERAAVVYAARRDVSIVLLFAGASDAFAEGVELFEGMLAHARFQGGPPHPGELGPTVEVRALGIELGLAEDWSITEEGPEGLSALLDDPKCHFDLRLSDTPSGDPREAARLALLEDYGLEPTDEQWQLVGGAPACDMGAETGSSFVRVIAIQADREILLATFSGAARDADDCIDQMELLLLSLRFTGEK